MLVEVTLPYSPDPGAFDLQNRCNLLIQDPLVKR
jgi:hypothetical protein